MVLIRARLIEKYIDKSSSLKAKCIKKITHEERFFSSMEKFHEWYDTFKDTLWENDPSKVELVEGVYVHLEELELDNTSKPKSVNSQATFRQEVSYKYAV